MKVYFETNSYGFKGPEVDPIRRLVAVWGDSVVFGIGRGWVEDLGQLFAGFQFLNGGLEGDGLENIRKRAIESNEKVKIDFNIVFPGWHSMKSRRKLRSILSSMVDQLPGPILCTVPTSLSERVTNMDLSSYFTAEPHYAFWGSHKYSIENARKLLHQLRDQNAIVRELARKRGLPLVDLYESFYTDDISKFRDELFDAGHPREESYPKIQMCFREALKSVLV
jgi:lysophospholipase L1-like esterase